MNISELLQRLHWSSGDALADDSMSGREGAAGVSASVEKGFGKKGERGMAD